MVKSAVPDPSEKGRNAGKGTMLSTGEKGPTCQLLAKASRVELKSLANLNNAESGALVSYLSGRKAKLL